MEETDTLASRLVRSNLTAELAERLLSGLTSEQMREVERQALGFAGITDQVSPAYLLYWLESDLVNASMARKMFKGFVEEPDRPIYWTPSVVIATALAAQAYIYSGQESLIVVPDNRAADLRQIIRDPAAIYAIDPYYFENLVGLIYELLGFPVKVTQRARDWGADVLVFHPSTFSDRVFRAIQVKRYSPTNKVGLAEVQRMKGVLADFHASTAEIVTSSWFTAPAKISAARPPTTVSLTDFADLMSIFHDVLSGRHKELRERLAPKGAPE